MDYGSMTTCKTSTEQIMSSFRKKSDHLHINGQEHSAIVEIFIRSQSPLFSEEIDMYLGILA